jgi:hypothetical protein
MSATNPTTLLAAGVKLLDHWQELLGAIIGGLLGVVGALLVAHDASNREHRNASRMLQRDLLNVSSGMIYGLTYHRKVTLETVGAQTLARNLSFYQRRLSPLFEAQMAVMIGPDTVLAGLLTGFHSTYSAVESHLNTYLNAGIGTQLQERAGRQLVRSLKFADEYAQAALYLLPLHELGSIHRAVRRLRRRVFSTSYDRAEQALVARMSSIHPDAEPDPAEAAG